MPIVSKAARLVQTLLGPLAEEVAREGPVIKRRRKSSASTPARAFILGFLAKRRPSDEDLAQMAQRCGVEVSTQAVEQRFTPDMAAFLEARSRRAVQQRLRADRAAAPLLRRFPAVFIHDSTSIRLPDELGGRFPGCGGSHGRGRAAIKLQVRLDLRGGPPDAVGIEAGRDCDQATPTRRDALTPGSLQIADLGYFDTKALGHLQGHGVFWISRLAFGTEIMTAAGEPIGRIADLFEEGPGVVDRAILMGKRARFACRAVIWPVPPEVANRRRQKLIATARDKGDAPPSPRRLDGCDRATFVTNVPGERPSADEVGVLYRARWQIEVCQAGYVSSDTLYRCPEPSHSGRLGVIGAGPMVSSTPRAQPGTTFMRRHIERHLPPASGSSGTPGPPERPLGRAAGSGPAGSPQDSRSAGRPATAITTGGAGGVA